jgi:hypothetical protein
VKRIAPLLVTFGLLIGGAVRADGISTETAHDLYDVCTTRNAVGEMFCAGYISGVARMFGLVPELYSLPRTGLRWCHTERVSNAQMLQAFKNWHNAHPEKWDMPSELAVITALMDTWPCKRQ